MADEPPPTLRELFDAKLETIRAELAANDKATILKAEEYERRLEILNGEHAVLAKMSETYVPNTIYQIDLAALKADGVKLRDGIDANRKSYTMLGISLGVTMMIALIGWALTLSGIHIH